MVCNNLFVCGLQISHSRNRIYSCPKARLNWPTHRPIRSNHLWLVICEWGGQIWVFIHKIFGYQVECEINTFLVGYLTRPITIWMDIRYFIRLPDSYKLSNGFCKPDPTRTMDRLKTDGPKMIILTCFNSMKEIFLFYGCWLERRKPD